MCERDTKRNPGKGLAMDGAGMIVFTHPDETALLLQMGLTTKSHMNHTKVHG